MATPPFQYGPTTDPTTQTYPLNPGNAAPALVVWLFLVTQPDFLTYLLDPKQGTPVQVDEIAQYTNLQPSAVGSILDSFRSANQQRQSSFNDVSTAFQDLCAAYNASYLPGQCPHDEKPMLWLAYRGTQVDPAAQVIPAPPRTHRGK